MCALIHVVSAPTATIPPKNPGPRFKPTAAPEILSVKTPLLPSPTHTMSTASYYILFCLMIAGVLTYLFVKYRHKCGGSWYNVSTPRELPEDKDTYGQLETARIDDDSDSPVEEDAAADDLVLEITPSANDNNTHAGRILAAIHEVENEAYDAH